MYRNPAKEVLRETMTKLLSQKNIEKISLAEILQESQMSKTTFYRNFLDKYALMNYCYSSKMEELTLDLRYDNWQDILTRYFQFYAANRAFMVNGMRANTADSLENFIYYYTVNFYKSHLKKVRKTSILSKEEEYAIKFNVAGSVRCLRDWLESGATTSPEEEARLHYNFMPDILKEIFIK